MHFEGDRLRGVVWCGHIGVVRHTAEGSIPITVRTVDEQAQSVSRLLHSN